MGAYCCVPDFRDEFSDLKSEESFLPKLFVDGERVRLETPDRPEGVPTIQAPVAYEPVVEPIPGTEEPLAKRSPSPKKVHKLSPFFKKEKTKAKKEHKRNSSKTTNISPRAELFRRFDPDRNGKIVPDEFLKLLAEYGLMFGAENEREFQALWAFFDITQTGYISYKDFQQLVVPDMTLESFMHMCQLLSKQNPKRFLKETDLKVRKEIHKEIVTNIRSDAQYHKLLDASTTEQLFNCMDVYRNGFVTYHDFHRVMQATAVCPISEDEEKALFDHICPKKSNVFKYRDLERNIGKYANADTFRFWAEDFTHQLKSSDDFYTDVSSEDLETYQATEMSKSQLTCQKADAILAVVNSKSAETSKETIRCVNAIVKGREMYDKLKKPSKRNYKQFDHAGKRPGLVFWDVEWHQVDEYAKIVRAWVDIYRPERLMISIDKTKSMYKLGGRLIATAFQELPLVETMN